MGLMRQAELRDRIDELEAAMEKMVEELATLQEDLEQVLGPQEDEESPEAGK